MAAKLRELYPRGQPWFNPGEFGILPSTTGKNIGYYWWEGGAAMGVSFPLCGRRMIMQSLHFGYGNRELIMETHRLGSTTGPSQKTTNTTPS
jgi:hypothetical protein